MRNILIVLIVVVAIWGCSSKPVIKTMNVDPAFNSKDFFESTVTLYSPLSVSNSNKKYSSTPLDSIKAETLNIIKQKLDKITGQDKVFLSNQKAPDYFKGNLMDVKSSVNFINECKTKYMFFIKFLHIGNKTNTTTKFDQNTGTAFNVNYGVTEATILYSIWDKSSGSSVVEIEVKGDRNDGILINSMTGAINNSVDAFIKYIKNINN